jgi:nicastrin
MFLKKSKLPISSLPKDIIFSLFDAETWSFAGSQRFVQDISSPFECKKPDLKEATFSCSFETASCRVPCVPNLDFTKIDFESIDAILEFDAVSDLVGRGSDAFYMHVDSVNAATNSLITAFQGSSQRIPGFNQSASQAITLQAAFNASTNLRLPPSSSQAFLERKKAIPAIVVSNFRTQYSNKYFQSEYDDGSQWNATHVTQLCALADISAKRLYSLASNSTSAPSSISVNCTKVLMLNIGF